MFDWVGPAERLEKTLKKRPGGRERKKKMKQGLVLGVWKDQHKAKSFDQSSKQMFCSKTQIEPR